MYDEHYGLSGRPFQLTPDPRFWFDTVTHKKAMAYLGYGLAQGEGFIVITGEIGAGKTTLVGHLMATIDRERLLAIHIASTQIEPDDLLRMVASGLSLDPDGMTKSQLLAAIERGLHATARAGRRTLLIVDEAQALNIGALEELRMLSNLQVGSHALLQIFLLGQPEFRERLQGVDRLEQLRQRVIAMHHLEPMNPEEVEPYMFHRLSLVGWNGRPRFTADAFAALYRGSEGVPRRLNQLAGRVMLHGAIEQLDTIDAHVVDAVIADRAEEMPPEAPAVAVPLAVEAPLPVADIAPVPEMPPLPIAAPAVAVEPASPVPIRGIDAIPVEPVGMMQPIEPMLRSAPAVDAPRADVLSFVPDRPEIVPDQVAHGDEPAADLSVPEPADEPVVEQDLAARLTALESRVDEQDAAMRRVLTLMVDWVDGGQRPDAAALGSVTG